MLQKSLVSCIHVFHPLLCALPLSSLIWEFGFQISNDHIQVNNGRISFGHLILQQLILRLDVTVLLLRPLKLFSEVINLILHAGNFLFELDNLWVKLSVVILWDLVHLIDLVYLRLEEFWFNSRLRFGALHWLDFAHKPCTLSFQIWNDSIQPAYLHLMSIFFLSLILFPQVAVWLLL